MEVVSLKRKKRKQTFANVAPIYIFILAWLVCALIFKMYTMGGLLASIFISAAAAIAGAYLISRFRKDKPSESEPEVEEAPNKEKAGQPKAPDKPLDPEVAAVVEEGHMAIKEMGRLYGSIQSPEVRERINELMRISDKIIQDAVDDPSDVPEIRKFLDYYLPTTIKLLNAYDRMSGQGIEGENLSRSMNSIEEMLDTAVDAFKKQLDSLFEDQALDIETDISVMNRMLEREGLTGDDEQDTIIKAARGTQTQAQDK